MLSYTEIAVLLVWVVGSSVGAAHLTSCFPSPSELAQSLLLPIR